MIEVLVYMKRGVEGVRKFEDSRNHWVGQSNYHRFHRGPNQEEPAVAACLADLLEKASTRSECMLIELVNQILQLDPDTRPKAKEVEMRMQFIAINTISRQIHELYTRVWQKGNSTQAFVEQARFSCWMQSCEILYTPKGSIPMGGWGPRSHSDYQSTLDCLVAYAALVLRHSPVYVMDTFLQVIIVYIFGGLTLLPIVISLILLHAYITFPRRSPTSNSQSALTSVVHRPGDDEHALKSGSAALADKFQRGREPDVAAGYFAVCREYVPGWINGKPPERTTPAGAVVAAESPSVYQSMYRSIFDRKQGPSLDNGKGNMKNVKKARNVFFVVLRYVRIYNQTRICQMPTELQTWSSDALR